MSSHITDLTPATPSDVDMELENRVVVFTDIVGSTSLIDLFGDRAWMQALTAHLEHAEIQALRFGGEFMKSTGDGTLAVFEDCEAAMAFAREMLRAPAGAADATGPFPVQLRIGLACGTVYRWRDDYFGRTVHLAARVCAAAQPGEILMSTTCTERCTELKATVQARRLVELRGFSRSEAVCADRNRLEAAGHGTRRLASALQSGGGKNDAN